MLSNKEYTQGGAMAWIAWILGVSFVLLAFTLQTGYVVINPYMKTELALTLAEIGTIAALYTWCCTFVQLFSGSILDRLGIYRVMPLVILITTVGAFIFSVAQDYQAVLWSQVILAVGGGSFSFVGAGFIGGKWFGPARFGLMFGLVQTIAAFGAFLNGNLLNNAVESVGWRDLLYILAVIGCVITALAFVFLRDRTPHVYDAKSSFIASIINKLFTVIKNPQVVLSALTGATLFGTSLAIAIVWGAKIMTSYGMDVANANSIALLMWLGLAIGSSFIDKLSQILQSRKKVVMWGNLLFFIVLVLFIYTPSTVFVSSVMMLVLGVANAAHMVNFTVSAENVPGEFIGTSAAVTNASMFFVGGVFLDLPGKFLGEQVGVADLQSAMLPMLVIMGVVILLGFAFLKETFVRSEK